MPTKNIFAKNLKMELAVIGFITPFCKKAEMLYGRSLNIKASIKQEFNSVQHYLHEIRVAYL